MKTRNWALAAICTCLASSHVAASQFCDDIELLVREASKKFSGIRTDEELRFDDGSLRTGYFKVTKVLPNSDLCWLQHGSYRCRWDVTESVWQKQSATLADGVSLCFPGAKATSEVRAKDSFYRFEPKVQRVKVFVDGMAADGDSHVYLTVEPR